MNIPGFSAEASLVRRRGYRVHRSTAVRADGAIVPQLKITATHKTNSRLAGICAAMGDLVNDAVQESQNASNPEDAQAWMDLAREMHGRATSNTGCSFGVA